jgi:hypothetical protein
VFTGTLVIASLIAVAIGGLEGSMDSVGLSPADAVVSQHVTHQVTPGASGGASTTTVAPTTRADRQPATGSSATGTAGMAGMTMSPAPVTQPILVGSSLAGTVPSKANPPNRQYHEFQVNCTITDHRADDPIVRPGRPGTSHNHTFFSNTTTNAFSTLASLEKGTSSCKVKADRSAYWMPTLYNGTKIIDPTETITYYKSDVIDYTSVRPFPKGLRFVAGSPDATEAQFAAHGYWSCVSGKDETDIPASCPAGNKLIARLVAPSCWDGVHLDVPDHHSNMAYPVRGRCPADHPVALPMLQFKIPYPVSGDMSKVRLSSGKGFSFHYDFFNAWDDATQAALVKTCINGGLQCDARGYDQHHPDVPAALTKAYKLP